MLKIPTRQKKRKEKEKKKNKLVTNTVRGQKRPSTRLRVTLINNPSWVEKRGQGHRIRVTTGPRPVPARPPGLLRKWPWLGWLFVDSRSRKREGRFPFRTPLADDEGQSRTDTALGPAPSQGPDVSHSGGCGSRQGPRVRAAPPPALTRTKTTTALRSRNSSPNGTGLPDASSTGSSATAVASGCPRSEPRAELGTRAGPVLPLTCRVTGARAGAAIALCIRGPGFAQTRCRRGAQRCKAGPHSGGRNPPGSRDPAQLGRGRRGSRGRAPGAGLCGVPARPGAAAGCGQAGPLWVWAEHLQPLWGETLRVLVSTRLRRSRCCREVQIALSVPDLTTLVRKGGSEARSVI